MGGFILERLPRLHLQLGNLTNRSHGQHSSGLAVQRGSRLEETGDPRTQARDPLHEVASLPHATSTWPLWVIDTYAHTKMSARSTSSRKDSYDFELSFSIKRH
jgi:hypothetical protein